MVEDVSRIQMGWLDVTLIQALSIYIYPGLQQQVSPSLMFIYDFQRLSASQVHTPCLIFFSPLGDPDRIWDLSVGRCLRIACVPPVGHGSEYSGVAWFRVAAQHRTKATILSIIIVRATRQKYFKLYLLYRVPSLLWRCSLPNHAVSSHSPSLFYSTILAVLPLQLALIINLSTPFCDSSNCPSRLP